MYNVDETGLTIVQPSPKKLAPVRQKQVSICVSAERRTLVTVIVGVSATDNQISPLFIFPKVNFKKHMIQGAPPGSIVTTNVNGWSNKQVFYEICNILYDLQEHRQ